MINQKKIPLISIKVLSLLLLFSISFISCSKDEIVNTEDESFQEQSEVPYPSYTMLHKSSEFIDNKTDVQKAINRVKKGFSNNTKKTFNSISSHDFKIFTENITYVYSPEDSTETYSFYIEKDYKRNNYVIENLILKKALNEEVYEAYIIKYFLKNGLSNPEENIQVAGFEEIDINDLQGISKECANTYEYQVREIKHDCYSGEHSGNGEEGTCDYEEEGGTPPYSTWSIVVLQNGCGGSDGGGTPTDPGSGDPTGPGGGGTGSGGANDGVDTGMSLPPSCQTEDCAEEDILANQINEKLSSSLSFEELIWLFDNNFQAQRIDNFLEDHSIIAYSIQAKYIALKAIQALAKGNAISFQEYLLKNRTFLDENNTNDINNNSVGGVDLNDYQNFNPAQESWPSISSVILETDFIGWGYPNIRENCMDYAKAQIGTLGYVISNYFNDNGQTIQVYTEQNGVNMDELSKGLNYLKYALENGIPVIVGVDLKNGTANVDTDNTTDHFIVIVGMGTDNVGRFFRFFDNASGYPLSVANPENKLYYDKDSGKITGSSSTSYATAPMHHDYIITQIRKSKITQ